MIVCLAGAIGMAFSVHPHSEINQFLPGMMPFTWFLVLFGCSIILIFGFVVVAFLLKRS